MMIYVCHQFGGNDSNRKAVENKIRVLYQEYGYYMAKFGMALFSPIHATGYLYTDLPYEDGMKLCVAMLAKCDAMLVFGDDSCSTGCMIEKAYCKSHDISIIEVEEFIAILEYIKRNVFDENGKDEFGAFYHKHRSFIEALILYTS